LRVFPVSNVSGNTGNCRNCTSGVNPVFETETDTAKVE
jgi:hypothetical protein